jgi:hypothetical protein
MATVNLFQNDASLESLRKSFQRDGFVVFHKAIDPTLVSTLQSRLDEVLRGEYNRNIPPDKVPNLTHADGGTVLTSPLGKYDGSLSSNTTRVLQIVNIHKCDHDFRHLATSPAIGRMVAELAGWKYGARLAQDQVWAK